MITRKLNQFVTNFSMSLNKAKHGSTVVVGGAIVNIFDTRDLCLDEEKGHEYPVFVTLDDGLGTFRSIFLRNEDPDKSPYDKHKDLLKPENVIIITGLAEKFKRSEQSDDFEVRVYAAEVNTLDCEA